MAHDRDEWLISGRWYDLVWLGGPDGDELELEDIAPAPGRGVVLRAYRSNEGGETTVTCYAEDGLPLAVFERFVREVGTSL